MIRRSLTATVVALGLFSATPSLALEEIKGAALQLLSAVTLDGSARAELLKFRGTNDAFGAFFISPDGTTSAWYSGAFSQADADLAARTRCEWLAQTTCQRYAILSPTTPVGQFAIPKDARDGFREAIRNTSSGRYAAFAANAVGGWGSSWNFATPDGARDQALLGCGVEAAKGRAETSTDLRAAFERRGVFDCKVITTMIKQ